MKVVHLFVDAELPCRIAQLRAKDGKKQDPDELARKDLPKLAGAHRERAGRGRVLLRAGGVDLAADGAGPRGRRSRKWRRFCARSAIRWRATSTATSWPRCSRSTPASCSARCVRPAAASAAPARTSRRRRADVAAEPIREVAQRRIPLTHYSLLAFFAQHPDYWSQRGRRPFERRRSADRWLPRRTQGRTFDAPWLLERCARRDPRRRRQGARLRRVRRDERRPARAFESIVTADALSVRFAVAHE